MIKISNNVYILKKIYKMSVSFFEFSPFSHYFFLKTFEYPVIIMCFSLYFEPIYGNSCKVYNYVVYNC